jgi:hypothetical protein
MDQLDLYLGVRTYDKEPGCRIIVHCGRAEACISLIHWSVATAESLMPEEVWPLPGRKIRHTAEPTMLRRWFELCTHIHSHEPLDAIQRNGESNSQLPEESQFRLVDVEENCIIPANMSYNYACLSYVWGDATPLRLTRENYARLTSPGGLNGYEHAPRTFRDAVQISRMLGI